MKAGVETIPPGFPPGRLFDENLGRDGGAQSRDMVAPASLEPVARRVAPYRFEPWIMAGAEGLEPPTSGFGDRRSTS